MDPNIALDELRANYKAFDKTDDPEAQLFIAERLVSLVWGMDEWL
jgi:hypothetical protein